MDDEGGPSRLCGAKGEKDDMSLQNLPQISRNMAHVLTHFTVISREQK